MRRQRPALEGTLSAALESPYATEERTHPIHRRRLRVAELRPLQTLTELALVVIGTIYAPDVWAAFDRAYRAQPGVQVWQVLSVPLWLVALQIFSDATMPTRAAKALLSTLGASALVALAVLALFFVAPFYAPRGSTLISVPLVGALVLLGRLTAYALVSSGMFAVRVAVLGTDEAAVKAARALALARDRRYEVVAFITPEASSAATLLNVPTFELGAANIWQLVRQLGVDQIVVGHSRSLDVRILEDLAMCFEQGVDCVPATRIYEEVTGRVLVSALEADWYADLPTRSHGLYPAAKRLIDFCVALAVLVLLSPLFAVVATGVAVDTGLPVLFRQIRVGQFGRRFVICKFRTMVREAERGGPAWAIQNDPRSTRTGRLLRRSRLDELPQLWNVLRGDMSLIGPRPERPEFTEQLVRELPLYRARSIVRPGITGWAQVQFPYAGSLESNLAKLEFDLYYVRHIGLLLDTQIAIRTIGVIVRLGGQ